MDDQRQLQIGAALLVLGIAAAVFFLQQPSVSTYGDLHGGEAVTDVPCTSDQDCADGQMCAFFSGQGVCVAETAPEQLCTRYECPDDELCVAVPADRPAVDCMAINE